MVIVAVSTFFFPNSHRSIQLGLALVAMLWVGTVIGYTIFLRFAVKCPVCGWRFSVRDKCRSCGLPRHASANADSDITSI